MNLPQSFVERMQALLGEEYTYFLESYKHPRYYGLRVNTLKWSVEEAIKSLPFLKESIPWTRTGFYYEETERPAKHPYYHAGLYYLQEPSAMAPAALLPIKPGDKVLDLCAAPGGKSTQAAARLAGKGVLVSNDINAERTKPLIKNLELFGVHNAVVTNESPERLARVFPAYFNAILIDAPCSGEGMFRKNPEMIKSWEQHSVEKCSIMQKDILEQAAHMLQPGGHILYSTCTFAIEENEEQIQRFLDQHPDFELVALPAEHGMQKGFSISNQEHLSGSLRLWPHHLKGEGHFLALLAKRGDGQDMPITLQETDKNVKRKGISKLSKLEQEAIALFEQEVLTERLDVISSGELVSFKGHISLRPYGLPALDGLKVLKSGWYLGEVKKNRFVPSQAFALGLKKDQVREAISWGPDAQELERYLKGETIIHDGAKGYKLILVDQYPIGWAKQVQGILKNEYPPGWRNLG